MSSIEQMSIHGIRSFGPNDTDRQIIKFFKPLTLILGPNGTGKTTIIECLNYLTTGEMPPGNGKGSAFVHDPKVAHEIEVKGQLRLQIKDLQGKQLVVQRSMKTTQKAKKVEFQTLDGVITRWKHNGEKVSISSRCAEIDKEMISALGVSKSILNNVIFCHQEDALWPLSEGKQLKQKFDNIFAATKYIKALNAINDIKKNQKNEIKLYNAELKYLKENKEFADELEENLKKAEKRFKLATDKVIEIDAEMKPLQEKLTHLESQSREIELAKNQAIKLQNEIEQTAVTVSTVSNNLTNKSYLETSFDLNFNGKNFNYIKGGKPEHILALKSNLGKAQKALANHESEMLFNQEKLANLETQNANIDKSGHTLEEQNSVLYMRKMALEKEKQNFAQLLKQRDAYISKHLTKILSSENLTDWNIHQKKFSINIDNINENNVSAQHDIEIKVYSRLLDELDAEKKKLDATHTKQRRILDDKIDVQRRHVDTCKEEKAKVESELQVHGRTLETNESDIKTLNRELNSMASDKERLDTIDKDIRKTEFEIKRETLGSILDDNSTYESPNRNKTKEHHTNSNNDSSTSVNVNTDHTSSIFNINNNSEGTVEERLKKDIVSLQFSKTKVDSRVSSLNTLLSKLHNNSQLRDRIKSLRVDIASKETERNGLQGKMVVIKKLIAVQDSDDKDQSSLDSEGDMAEHERFQGGLERYLRQKSQAINESQERLSNINVELSTLKAENSHSTEKLEEFEKELASCEQEILELCNMKDIGEELSNLEQSLNDLHERKGALLGSQTIYKKFSDRLKDIKCCPICNRNFQGTSSNKRAGATSNEQTFDDLIKDLERKLSIIPPKLAETNTSIDKFEGQYHELLELKPKNSSVDKYKRVDIPKIKTVLLTLEQKICEVTEQLENEQKVLSYLNAEGTQAKNLIKDAIIYDKLCKDIADLKERCAIESQKSADIDSEDDRNLNSVLEEKEELDLKAESLNKEIEFKKQKLSNHNDRLQRLERKINALQGEKLKIQSGLQKRTQLEDKKGELFASIKFAKEQIEYLKPKILPIQAKLLNLESDVQSLVKEKEDYQRSAWQALENINKLTSDLKHHGKQITSYLDASSGIHSIETLNDQMTSLEIRLKSLKTNKMEVCKEIDDIKSEIAHEKVKERDITDSIQILKWQAEISQKTANFQELGLRFSPQDSLNLLSQIKQHRERQEKLTKDSHQLGGMKSELTREIARLKATAQNETYKLSKEKYVEALVKFRTTQLALKDLTIYHKAFDRAIMTYHSIKMNEINKIVRQLWKQTYRGNDIDYIEIRSDVEDGFIMAANAKLQRDIYNDAGNSAQNYDNESDPNFDENDFSVNNKGGGKKKGGRKNPPGAKKAKLNVKEDSQAQQMMLGGPQRSVYNYRVVMVKDDVELDMRNRCSAGQKVLASLIIRLALAETFCLNCGILALDEPTTNLDQENIESLAYALIQIINDRSAQRNFQLIIITHDEDFINLLAKADFVDNYYRVGKSVEGYSTISKVNIRS
ncbi:unnamed protein product [Gordionus sp. m RMFG-2023]|uniref:DNA repair protein RAD50-like n=1 Tax=Gordionus sp. m RMFG-2023 TaxID=3053472 RepID=UPI0030E51163